MPDSHATNEVDFFDGLGDEDLNALIPKVYAELKRLAAYHLQNERPNHTLHPTELVHEVYLLLHKQHSLEARKQQHIAEQRFEQVRKIANTFIFDYHDEIAKLDGSTKLRERLVTDGVNYLDAVAREETNDPELLKESAIAYRKIGDAQGKPYMANLGKTEDAILSYRKSVALLEQAVSLAPGDLTLKDELIESYRLLSNVEGRVGNRDQAKLTLLFFNEHIEAENRCRVR